MRKIFEEDLSLDDVKSLVKRWRQKEACNYFIAGAAILGIVIAAAIVTVLVLKNRCCCDYDDFDDDDFDDYDDCYDDNCHECADGDEDENGCRYAEEKDFEN